MYKKFNYLIHLIIRYLCDRFSFIIIDQKEKLNEKDIINWQFQLNSKKQCINNFFLKDLEHNLIPFADEIVNHHFIIFSRSYLIKRDNQKNSNEYQKIDWFNDKMNNKQFSHNYWYRLRVQHPKGGEIKFPWELSRFQHALILGKAYIVTKDEIFTKAFIAQIRDWVIHNPVRYGINWSNTMEVGIRSATMSLGLLFFIESKELDQKFFNLFLKSMNEHGNHIYNNLENLQSNNSNHYIGNLFGLFFIALIFSLFHESKKWLSFAQKELEKEIYDQTFEDGWGFESSVPYHKLITEMFLYCYILGKNLEAPFSKSFEQRLFLMLKNLFIIAKPNNMIPQIGDNDSSKIFSFMPEASSLDLKEISILINKNNININNTKQFGFFAFKNAGYYLYKSRNIYFLFNSGPEKLIGLGSHAHNDVFSFELNINGKDIIVDPGSYIYTSNPKLRNHFRSVKSHNTLFWPSIEPRRINNGLFKMLDNGRRVIKFTDYKDEGFKLYGSYNFDNKFHNRSIFYEAKKHRFSIIDKVSHKDAIVNFNIALNNDLKKTPNGFFVNNINFTFQSFKKLKVENSFYSESYLKKEKINSVKVFLKDKILKSEFYIC